MTWLKSAASSVDHLEGVVVAKLPECVAWEAWHKGSWEVEEVAAYFADMSRAGRNALKTVGALGDDIRLTIEAGEKLIITDELSASFVAVFIFQKKIPLGMARLRMRQVSRIIRDHLPSSDVAERSRAERIMAFLLRYAPDAHAVPMRVALQTGIALERLNQPAALTREETAQLEGAARGILGIQQLRI